MTQPYGPDYRPAPTWRPPDGGDRQISSPDGFPEPGGTGDYSGYGPRVPEPGGTGDYFGYGPAGWATYPDYADAQRAAGPQGFRDPVTGQPGNPNPYAYPVQLYPPQRQNEKAVAALICAVGTFGCGLLIIPATILGVQGLKQSKLDPMQTGRGMSIGALTICGVLYGAALIYILFVIVMFIVAATVG